MKAVKKEIKKRLTARAFSFSILFFKFYAWSRDHFEKTNSFIIVFGNSFYSILHVYIFYIVYTVYTVGTADGTADGRATSSPNQPTEERLRVKRTTL